jgi:hypothetical protein
MLLDLSLPSGLRDLLPDHSAHLAELSSSLQEVFSRFGYRRVFLPTLERLEVVERGLSAAALADVMKFVEPGSGEVVAIRPDITPQIARLYAATDGRDDRHAIDADRDDGADGETGQRGNPGGLAQDSDHQQQDQNRQAGQQRRPGQAVGYRGIDLFHRASPSECVAVVDHVVDIASDCQCDCDRVVFEVDPVPAVLAAERGDQ